MPRALHRYLETHSSGGMSATGRAVVVNQQMRHAACAAAVGSIRAGTTRAQMFVRATSDAGLLRRVRVAQQRPHSAESARVIREVLPFMNTIAQNVPLHPGARGQEVSRAVVRPVRLLPRRPACTHALLRHRCTSPSLHARATTALLRRRFLRSS
jgi:hypothetical protein